MAHRKVSVDLHSDDLSTADKLWKWLSEEQAHTGAGRSLIKKGYFTFDYSLEVEDEKIRGMTPLMVTIEKNYATTALNLLTFGADPNVKHEATGDTALHLAVDNGNLVMVKLLLAFRADPTISNRQNLTPLDIATNMKNYFGGTPDISTTLGTMFMFKNAPSKMQREIRKEADEGNIKEILKVLMESMKLYAKTKHYFSENTTIVPRKERQSSDLFLLSLDGGGIRGLVSTHIMANIEERLQQLTSTPQKMSTFFDYIAGTSSGGMIACLLAYQEYGAYDATAAMMNGIAHIVNTPTEKRGYELDTIYQQTFTKERVMSDLDPKYRVIVTASRADHIPYEVHLITSYGESRDGHAAPKERKVWEACRITSAAPFLSPLFNELKLLDGGLVCNNPTLVAMAEILDQIKKEESIAKLKCVVSIGTGMAPPELNKEVDFFSPSAFSRLLHVSKSIQSLQSLASHIFSQTTASDGQYVTRARSICSALGCQYFRLTPPLKESVFMATTDGAKLAEMLYSTQMYCFDNPELINSVAGCLLSK